jgi:hypothetical protein
MLQDSDQTDPITATSTELPTTTRKDATAASNSTSTSTELLTTSSNEGDAPLEDSSINSDVKVADTAGALVSFTYTSRCSTISFTLRFVRE